MNLENYKIISLYCFAPIEAEVIPEFNFFKLLVTVSASLPIHETMPRPVITTLFITIYYQIEKAQPSYL